MRVLLWSIAAPMSQMSWVVSREERRMGTGIRRIKTRILKSDTRWESIDCMLLEEDNSSSSFVFVMFHSTRSQTWLQRKYRATNNNL
jgi:hypothetical protein